VFVAKDLISSKKKVAIKIIPMKTASKSNLSEVAFLLSCKGHPNIVQMNQCYKVANKVTMSTKASSKIDFPNLLIQENEEELWIVMEYLEGGTLAEAARANKFSDQHIAFMAREML